MFGVREEKNPAKEAEKGQPGRVGRTGECVGEGMCGRGMEHFKEIPLKELC